ncbi:MAG: type VI secretion system protein ImpG [Planctomycetota bacterium]|jgi:type VI secretion system protein ImpG
MTESLLHYYNRELSYLRQMGAQFAEAHPKIAGRLRLGSDTVEDPHVSRLIESVAFLNARVRCKLEDEFPELTDAILGVLYPHYLSPIPSMAIVQFECDPGLTSSYEIARGTGVQTDRSHGDPCRYQTAYPVEAWPIKLTAASLNGTPFDAPPAPFTNDSVAALRLTLEPLAPEGSLAELAPNKLRFFLRSTSQLAHAMYEMIFNDLLGVTVGTSASDRQAVVLGADSVQPVGFGADESLLPYPDRSMPGYRILTEYFAFQKKFLFFDVCDLPAFKFAEGDTKLEVFLYFSRSQSDLEQSVEADSFALGCTPVVNLFKKRTEPIRLSHTKTEYRIEPDARRPLSMEVYSVDHVSAVSPTGERKDLEPYFGFGHGLSTEEDVTQWYSKREPAVSTETGINEGTDVSLRLVDPNFDPSAPGDWILNIETHCTNRDLPSKLPFGLKEPIMQFSDGGGPITGINCLTPPTSTVRPEQGRAMMWRVISHLSLNHLSITSGSDGPEALREILSIYNHSDSADNRAVIAGILDVSSHASAMQVVSQGLPGVVRGTSVQIEFDRARFVGSGLYLFASVLERFLGGYCSINSFVQLAATIRGQEGVFAQWEPSAGDRSLI